MGGGGTCRTPLDGGCVPHRQSCKEEADAILFLFSFTDRSSFEELPAHVSRVVGPDEENLVRVVVGTKYPSRGALGASHHPISGFVPPHFAPPHFTPRGG